MDKVLSDLQHAIASIRTGTPVRLTDFATGVAYMRFTDAVHRAVAQSAVGAVRL